MWTKRSQAGEARALELVLAVMGRVMGSRRRDTSILDSQWEVYPSLLLMPARLYPEHSKKLIEV